MGINSVVLNDGTADRTYDPINIGSQSVYYRDVTNSTLALPRSLEIQHQPGSATKPDRHLVKLSYTDDDSVDVSLIETATVHMVITLPRRVVTPTIAKNLAKQLADFAGDATLMDAILNGGFPG